MTDKLRILVTGFGPFPGAPFNPTSRWWRACRLRRLAQRCQMAGHILPVTYKAVDREPPELLAKRRPDALLMFRAGFPHAVLRIETRARAVPSPRCGGAARARVRKGSIAGGADAMMFGPHTAKLLRAAVGTGIDARASRDAGSYLCNYLSWRAIEATCGDTGPRLAAFVHVPPLPRNGAPQRKGATHRVTLEELVDAGEAMLLEMVKLARRTAQSH